MTQLRMTRRRILGAGAALAAAPLIAGSFSQPAAAAAPMLGPAQPKNLRFKLGAFEVTMISDSEAFIDGPWPLIGKNARQEEVDRLLLDNLLPANKYRPGFTPMVVNRQGADPVRYRKRCARICSETRRRVARGAARAGGN